MPLLHDLSLHPKLLKALDKLGFTEATPVQAESIPGALAGKDLMVSAATGSGKTAAFLLPLIDRLLNHAAPNSATRALILLPTRELALQTKKNFEQLAAFTPIKCGLIMGGEAFKHQVATLRKNPEVIIATPGRLVDHIEKGTTDFRDLEVLVLDEADRMLDMGFAIAMNAIADCCNKQRQNLLFSATLSHKGLGQILKTFNQPLSIEVGSPRQQHLNIQQQLVLADSIKHKEKLVTALIAEEQARKVFVFCNTRQHCQQLSHVLKYNKLKVNFIHGEISQNDRKQIMNQFRQGSIDVLVATDLAARGLDIDDVDLVINFNIAQSGDDHIHRVGRTGRAGQEGKAITIIDSNEWNQMSSIERYLGIRFEHRVVKDLKANYTGPKKLKNSGKSVGAKKKKVSKADAKAKAKSAKKNKAGTGNLKPVTGDGFGVMRKKK
ncbi:DEAD/DEAH box helicase [Oceanicoccus sp. KOV_DT_Chl]|uniref:DEAD/DEAH box helicase n=1 Tax=Oceanicoccus sp. KOV_DT_Chl TaxID=1904639 RepID=UPI000C7A4947|nr:DEAD/DEAH box helicase [Oceanicoccus sp. KOV_DT_Chl]